MAEKEQPMFEDRSRKIADNVVLLAVARLSMALSLPALGLVAYLFNQNLEQKFATQDQKITAQKEASQNESRVNTARIETVEKSAQAAMAQTTQVNERLISGKRNRRRNRRPRSNSRMRRYRGSIACRIASSTYRTRSPP
jgi:hypothetical protein